MGAYKVGGKPEKKRDIKQTIRGYPLESAVAVIQDGNRRQISYKRKRRRMAICRGSASGRVQRPGGGECKIGPLIYMISTPHGGGDSQREERRNT